MADDHNDSPSVALEASCSRTLQHLIVRTERGVEGNVDASRNVASVEAGGRRVKE